MSLKSKIQALITAANAKTGETATDLTGAVQDLVDGYGQGGGLPKIATVATNPTETTYGRIEIPAEDGIFMLTNPSVTPTSKNRLARAMLIFVDTSSPSQSATAYTYTGGSIVTITSGSGQEAGICYFSGSFNLRFAESASYDLYKLN